MSVSSTARKAQFTSDQTTSSLAFTFRALTSAPTDIKVALLTGTTERILTYTTHYTVTISSNGVGGTVHLVDPTALSTGTLTVYRVTTNKQESDYDDYNQFPANTLETDLDRRTMVDQEQDDDLGRTIKLPVSSTLTGLELPLPSAGKALKWNAAETAMVNTTVDIDTAIDTAIAAATAATISANTASTQVNLATTQASNALLYANQASTQGTNALLYANQASTSSTTAGNYASTASTQATNVVNYASTASTQATNAANYAITAGTNATKAGNYATTSGTNATNAGNYATTAGTNATNATNSASTASTQALLATTQATNALTQANLASTSATTASATLQIIVNAVTSNYVLAATDVNKLVDANSTGTLTVYVPLNATIAIPTGSVIAIRQKGAGQVVIAPTTSGVTINTSTGLKISGIYGMAAVLKLASDTWTSFGDLEA